MEHINDTDVDPIEVINSQDSPNSNNECALYNNSKSPFDNDFNQYSITKCEHLEQQQQQLENNIADESKDSQDLAVGSQHLDDDNDYDDHSMIDLSSETKSNYDSDEKGTYDSNVIVELSVNFPSLQTKIF